MEIHASLFLRVQDTIDVHPDAGGQPILRVGTLAIHLPDEAKLVELQDHIAAYLARDDSEMEAAAC